MFGFIIVLENIFKYLPFPNGYMGIRESGSSLIYVSSNLEKRIEHSDDGQTQLRFSPPIEFTFGSSEDFLRDRRDVKYTNRGFSAVKEMRLPTLTYCNNHFHNGIYSISFSFFSVSFVNIINFLHFLNFCLNSNKDFNSLSEILSV